MFFRRSFTDQKPPQSRSPGGSDGLPASLPGLRGASASGVEVTRMITLGGRDVEVILRRHAKARRISLRVDTRRDAAVLTLPPRTAEREAIAFLMKHGDWITDQIDALPARIHFEAGAEIPFLGRDRLLVHTPEMRGTVRLDPLDESQLQVAGAAEHFARRVTDFMKREARAAIKPLVADKAARIGRQAGRIILRDQRTRWGSCTSSGDLNFSWRLIYCPPDVLDYVVAHEVAHLRHMDHSPAFWATVAEIAPTPKQTRAWLRHNCHRLHRIG